MPGVLWPDMPSAKKRSTKIGTEKRTLLLTTGLRLLEEV